MTVSTRIDLSIQAHEALSRRAAENGRTAEAEAAAILEEAVVQPTARTLATELAAIGERFGVTTEFDNLRDKTPAKGADFD